MAFEGLSEEQKQKVYFIAFKSNFITPNSIVQKINRINVDIVWTDWWQSVQLDIWQQKQS